MASFRALALQVRAMGLLDRRPGYYRLKITLTIFAFPAGWVMVVIVGNSWTTIAVAALAGIIFTQLGFISHDAGHNQVFGTRRRNRLLGLIVGNMLIGQGSFHPSMKASIAAMRSWTGVKPPRRRIACRVVIEKKISTQARTHRGLTSGGPPISIPRLAPTAGQWPNSLPSPASRNPRRLIAEVAPDRSMVIRRQAENLRTTLIRRCAASGRDMIK